MAIDLGNEPPLSVDGEVGELDRRRISVQWFSATILTGLCGAALMGGAVFAALDGEANFAASPERFEAGLRGTLGSQGERTGMRKGDRLPAVTESVAARQVIRVSTTARIGDREMVRVRPYVRVGANLSLSLSEASASIPPFNPQKLIAEPGANASASEDLASAAPDAEVTYVTRDLGSVLPRAKIAVSVPLEDILGRVREAANWTGAGQTRYASADLTGATRLAYAVEGDIDPYAGFEARIVPENITLLPKTAAQATGGAAANERVLPVKKGDTVGSILRELGATPEEIKAIAALLGPRGRDSALKEGQKLRVLLSPGAGGRAQPARVVLIGETATEAVVALSDLGKYVSVDVQSAMTQQVTEVEEDDDGTGVRLYQSLYETSLRNNIPRPVIEDLVRIYSYDVDFQRKAQAGDSFEVVYAGEDDPGGKTEVLYAGLVVGGEAKKFYRYQAPDDGVVDYYDETGKSAKKFLVRKPVPNGIMRSGFGSRHHPILGYTKMHTGVDWAAPMGTPIFASGNGTLEKVGWESGYGKYIRIRHANGYETAYGHMTAYARGMDIGTKVRQGQVIGFVGSTGLSTGAHLHYEILVNGRLVDPMRVRLPRGRVLDGPALASFERERDRINGMMGQSPARVAQSSR
ncbi:peptidoglycan DD-metalloendopeptidase family protein [Rhodoplanes sp.]|uniref:peptidoglycan DD-metalloendopeptidase family protein n=1 Tax=Rhodoplanes sp. TaxID=1968906 RepID=UPI0025CCF8AD|nr:peptidoglycan DD-metalloendopeptidase family protein [Rhodoplanes sp.]